MGTKEKGTPFINPAASIAWAEQTDEDWRAAENAAGLLQAEAPRWLPCARWPPRAALDSSCEAGTTAGTREGLQATRANRALEANLRAGEPGSADRRGWSPGELPVPRPALLRLPDKPSDVTAAAGGSAVVGGANLSPNEN